MTADKIEQWWGLAAQLSTPAEFERLLREKHEPILDAEDYARLREKCGLGHRRRIGEARMRGACGAIATTLTSVASAAGVSESQLPGGLRRFDPDAVVSTMDRHEAVPTDPEAAPAAGSDFLAWPDAETTAPGHPSPDPARSPSSGPPNPTNGGAQPRLRRRSGSSA